MLALDLGNTDARPRARSLPLLGYGRHPGRSSAHLQWSGVENARANELAPNLREEQARAPLFLDEVLQQSRKPKPRSASGVLPRAGEVGLPGRILAFRKAGQSL